MRKGFACFALVGVVTALSACESAGDAAAEKLRFDETYSFDSVDCPNLERHVIRDQTAWEALWLRTHPANEPLPAVDFSNETVLAVCGPIVDGIWHTISGFEADGNELTAYDTQLLPGAGCAPLTEAGTFHAVRVEDTFDSVRFVSEAGHDRACITAEAGEAFAWETLTVSPLPCSENTGQLITTQEAWDALWLALHAEASSPPAQPAVDFATHSVIAVCLPPNSEHYYVNFIRYISEPDGAGHVSVGGRGSDYWDCSYVEGFPVDAYHVAVVNRPLAHADFRYLARRRCHYFG